MGIISGSFSGRFWRTSKNLPADFEKNLELGLRRYAFKPVDVDRGHLRSMGWVNIRQILDARPTPAKSRFDNLLALGLRVDRITINPKVFRATLAEEIGKALRERKGAPISRDQRLALEEQVRQKLIRAQVPSTTVMEMLWDLESGLILFTASGDKPGAEFADLFTQTFGLAVEPEWPYLRAERHAKRQGVERDLMELLPSPFSPNVPVRVVEVVEAGVGERE